MDRYNEDRNKLFKEDLGIPGRDIFPQKVEPNKNPLNQENFFEQ